MGEVDTDPRQNVQHPGTGSQKYSASVVRPGGPQRGAPVHVELVGQSG
jgi:hypothetical protein